MLRAVLLCCIACGDGILVARELEQEDEMSSDEAKREDHKSAKEESVSGRHRVGPRPTRRSPHHRADFAKVHLRDAGSHALDD